MAEYVLIGGGLTSGRAALTLIENGVKDQITILTNEPYYPYERPGLSKGYLQGKESEDELYTDKKTMESTANLAVVRNVEITKIDRQSKKVSSKDGQSWTYDKLLLATGSTPVKLTIPGADLPRVHYLRTIPDADAIKKAVSSGSKSAVVIGGSFIGMEVASSLAQLGVETTVIHRGKMVFDKLNSESLSQKFLNYYAKHGVEFVLEDEAKEITSDSLITKKGQTIPAQIVVAGIGVTPNIELAKQAGLAVDNGVIVNEFLETSDNDIFAGGDIAYFPDLIAKTKQRIEHWDVANDQGKYIAERILGKAEPYRHLSYFFSHVFDLSFDFYGYPELAKRSIDIDHWTDKEASYIVLYGDQNDMLVAAFIMNSNDDKKTKITQAIEKQTPLGDDFVKSIQ